MYYKKTPNQILFRKFRLENKRPRLIARSFVLIRDREGIQTPNLLIRSETLYSVEPCLPAGTQPLILFKIKKHLTIVRCFSDREGIQTPNLLIRSETLYSVELRSQSLYF